MPVVVGTVRSWEQGRSKPRHEILAQIAELTGKPMSWFYGEEEADMTDEIRRLRERLEQIQHPPPLNGQLVGDFTFFPLLGHPTAGSGGNGEQEVEDQIPVPTKSLPRGLGTECFFVEVSGDSMIDAGIQDGALLLISPTAVVSDGDIVLVDIEGEAMIKRAYIYDPQVSQETGAKRVTLVSDNPNYKPLVVDRGRIVGRVMQGITNYG